MNVYTIKEASKILKYSPHSLRNWANEGKIKARKVAGTRRWIIDESEVNRLLGVENNDADENGKYSE